MCLPSPVIYPVAGHGFAGAAELAGASEANQRGRTQAWERWKALLKKL